MKDAFDASIQISFMMMLDVFGGAWIVDGHSLESLTGQMMLTTSIPIIWYFNNTERLDLSTGEHSLSFTIYFSPCLLLCLSFLLSISLRFSAFLSLCVSLSLSHTPLRNVIQLLKNVVARQLSTHQTINYSINILSNTLDFFSIRCFCFSFNFFRLSEDVCQLKRSQRNTA